jgi:hypothetical protein
MAGVMMSLSDLASLGSFVSGFAVLVSLVFLYFQVRQVNSQVRQAEQSQRALAQQARASRASELWLSLAHSGVGERYNRVLNRAEAEDVTVEDLTTSLAVFRAFIYGWEDAYFQRSQQLLDDAAFASTVAAIEGHMSRPGGRALWSMNRANHDPSFQTFMDRLIAETPVVRPPPILERWSAAIKQAEAA